MSISGTDKTNPADWITANNGTVPTNNNAIWNAVKILDGSNGYRLPTEAQWEYACRARTTTAYNTGDNIPLSTEPVLWWYTNSSGMKTHQVGQLPANTFELYDMHGNVFEWCWDRYGGYTSEAQTDPTGYSDTETCRVYRGGAYNQSAATLRSAYRPAKINPFAKADYIGFRVVRPQ